MELRVPCAVGCGRSVPGLPGLHDRRGPRNPAGLCIFCWLAFKASGLYDLWFQREVVQGRRIGV